MAECFLDSTIFDIGVLKIFKDDTKIKAEKVFPNEIFVDEQEARFGKATHLYQVREVSRYALEKEFGSFPMLQEADHENLIADENNGYEDNITCIEAWHLPSSEGADDGRHVICVEGTCLFEESWSYDDFPFIILRWNNANISWYGQSLSLIHI